MFNKFKAVNKAVAVFVTLGLLCPSSAYSARQTGTAQSPNVLDLFSRALLLSGSPRSEVRNVRFGFEKQEKYYTNSYASYRIANLFKRSIEQIPDQVVQSVKGKLKEYLGSNRLKGVLVNDYGATDIDIHVTHNAGEMNASVHRLMLNAIRAGLKKAEEMDLLKVQIDTLSNEELVKQLDVIANDDSKVERPAESVVVAKGIGVGIGAVNIRLYEEFAVAHATPLRKLNKSKAPGFKFRLKKIKDILAGNLNGPEWEFEVSSDQRDPKTRKILRAGKNESVELLALASQPDDYAITAVYPVEGAALPAHEPAATVIYQRTFGKEKEPILNPTIIYRSQSGANAVGGIASIVYKANFVPGGPAGEHYVATSPATFEEARQAPKEKGIGYFTVYGYQSRWQGVIPIEAVRDHKGLNSTSYGPKARRASRLAKVMSDHEDDQPYLTPEASEKKVHKIRKDQDSLFYPTVKESETDPFLEQLEDKVEKGELIAADDDKADNGSPLGHTYTPEFMVAIDQITMIEAMEQGLISYGTTIGFAGKHQPIKIGKNVGVGDDQHLITWGDRSRNGANSHQLSFLGLTRSLLFAQINDLKLYGQGQDFQGPEAKAAKANPFKYSKLTPRSFELMRQYLPQEILEQGMVDKLELKWHEWQQTKTESVTIEKGFSGNVSEQGIGSARYLVNPKEEKTFDMIAGDKMGPAAFNRLIKHTVFDATKAEVFKNGLVFEIWDLKAFDDEGNIPLKDIPSSLSDIKMLVDQAAEGKKISAEDGNWINNVAYQNGKLTVSNEEDQKHISKILKRSGYVPSKRIFLDAVKDREAAIRYLADSDRFNVKHVWGKTSPDWDIKNPKLYLDRPLLAASVTRLGILAGGEYVGKDDPVMLGHSQLLHFAHEFLKTRPLIVQGDMNGSHWEGAVPTSFPKAVATDRSHPILVGLRYTISKDAKTLSKVKDIYAEGTSLRLNAYDKIRDKIYDFNDEFDAAQISQFGPHATNVRTVEGSYELAKILDDLNQPDSPFLIANKKKELEEEAKEKGVKVDTTWPVPMANRINEVYAAALSEQAEASLRSEVRRADSKKSQNEPAIQIDLSGLELPEVQEESRNGILKSFTSNYDEAMVIDETFVIRGGLAFVGTVFLGPTVVRTTDAKVIAQVKAFNKKYPRSAIGIAADVAEAKAELQKLVQQRLSDLGGVRAGSFKYRGIATEDTSEDIWAEFVKELKEPQVTRIYQWQFSQMAESAGLGAMVNLLAQTYRKFAVAA